MQSCLGRANATFAAMQPYVSEFSYQNFLDPQLGNPLHAKYGGNLPRVVRVKAAEIPGNMFHSPQSIPTCL